MAGSRITLLEKELAENCNSFKKALMKKESPADPGSVLQEVMHLEIQILAVPCVITSSDNVEIVFTLSDWLSKFF